MNPNPVLQFQARVLTAARGALKATATAVKKDMRPRIDSRRTPGGGGQQANASKYAAVKARKYGHTTPLWGKGGILRDPDRYKLIQRDGWTWIIYPPAERVTVIQRLRQRGYEWFEVPREALSWLVKELKMRLP